jgi:2,4-dienoyl-CoA reductase-like NADH-dependent reductase (Old Yellow Enzyme family)
MANIKDSITIRGREIKNRIAMLPMYTFSFHGDGNDFYGSQHIDHYTEAATGGTGLIILQATHVSGVLTETEQWTPGSKKALKVIADNARAQGATVLMQLACGDTDINELSTGDLLQKQREMLAAAITAAELGYHGVEYHFAHGFYLCKLLDAAENKRADTFGGSLENRMRILTDILPELRGKTEDNFIVGVRFGLFTPTKETGILAAKMFESAGVDFLDITFGMTIPEFTVSEDFPFSAITYCGYTIKQVVTIPVIGVNDINTGEQAQLLLERGYADIAGIGCGMLADLHFAEKILSGIPVNKCYGCARCKWFTDHTKCPARTK